MVKYVMGNRRTRADHSEASYRRPTDDRGVGADGRPFSYKGRKEFILALNEGARRQNIGKNAGWAAEYVVFQCDAAVERDIILNFATIADQDVGPRHNVLANDTAISNAGARQDVAKMPYFRPGADFDAIVNYRRLMNEKTSHRRQAVQIHHLSEIADRHPERRALGGLQLNLTPVAPLVRCS